MLQLILLFTFTAGAESGKCPWAQSIVHEMVVNHFDTMAEGCLIQITPLNKPGIVYREYYFDQRGMLAELNSLSADYDHDTATHSYFLFPRAQNPEYTIREDGTIVVTLSTGRKIELASSGPKITAFPGSVFSEPESLGLQPENLLSLSDYPGVWLDTGVAVGGFGYMDKTKSSVFHDGKGATCSIANGLLFDYVNILYSEPTFRFETDADLAAFLRVKCPGLDLSSL